MTREPLRASGMSAILVCSIAVCLSWCATTTASTPAGVTEAPYPLEVQSYARAFGVSLKEATENLATQERGAEIVQQLKSALGKRYAGVWFDNERGEFVVPRLASVSPATVSDALGAAQLQSDFRFASAESSWAAVEAAQQRLDQALRGSLNEQRVLTALDPRTNAVVVLLSKKIGKVQREEAQSMAADERVRAEVRLTNPSDLKFGATSCDKIERICGKPLRGGVAIGEHTYGGIHLSPQCSSGFKAIGNAFGNRFILTAGHCGEDGAGWKSAIPALENEAKSIGLAENINFPGGDWEKIKANGSYWDTASWPSRVAVWGQGEAEEERPILAESSSYIGQWVCHSGFVTGSSCGSVVWTNVTAERVGVGGGWVPVYHLTLFEGSELCASEGDSGGPVFAGNTALGLLSGDELGAPTCGPRYVQYVEIIEASDNLGVTVAPRVGAPPVAETGVAMGFPGPRQAQLSGWVDPNGVATNYYFEYGTTPGYGSSSQLWGAGSGWHSSLLSQPVDGLKGQSTYHFRIVAQNAEGVAYGEDETFTTPAWPPISTTKAATNVKANSATLNGTVNPQGSNTHYGFEIGKTTAYGTKVPLAPQYIGQGTSDVAVSQPASGLEPGTTYHFRVGAVSDEGTTYGNDLEFKTPDKPTVITEPPLYTNTLEPQLVGKVDPERASTTYQFEYGLTTSYGSKIPLIPINVGSGDTSITVEQTLKGLERNKTYHYRITAKNEVGTTNGSDKSFTTLPPCKGPEEKCVWSVQSGPNPAPSTEDKLKGISCASTTMCMAVGRNVFKGKSFVELWNGSEWKVAQDSISGEMKKVSCPTTTMCMSVGAASGGGLAYWQSGEVAGQWISAGGTPPTPAGGSSPVFNSVSCTSTSACTAVGSYYTGTEYRPLVERWNGTSWSIESAPNPLEGNASEAMLSVSCVTFNTCVTVGKAAGKPVAQRWNGNGWSLLSVPNPSGATDAGLRAISCTITYCLAVGSFREGSGVEKTLAERYNGTTWSVTPTPNPSEAKLGTLLEGVSCRSSSCYAVGYYANEKLEYKTVAQTWDGSTWTLQTTPNPAGAKQSTLLDVSCPESTSCTAVGSAQPGPEGETYVTLAERWNGSAWSIQPTPNPLPTVENKLTGISCASTTMCMAVGRNVLAASSFVGLWNGTKWKVAQNSISGEMKKVSCPTTTMCMSVGAASGGGLAYWQSGEVAGQWISAGGTPPTPAGGSSPVFNSVSCTSTSACTAVGSYYTGTEYRPLVERWNGTSWSIESAPNPLEGNASEAMLSVSCFSATFCTAVGKAAGKPVVQRWNGSEWSRSTVPNPSGAVSAGLGAVSCASATNCMAVGGYRQSGGVEKPLAERWNNGNWSVVATPAPSEAKYGTLLNGVSCLSPNSCFAVGFYAASSPLETKTGAMSWSPSSWTLQTSPNSPGSNENSLADVSCTSSIACTAVGNARPGPAEENMGTLVERYE